ncbi:CNP1-like family protein [Crenobacter sp. SG2303]|uniref:CNP1-like family protein n=1 Tax=Crenobacter oryzisoli TaxID=3056844 RepID=A0ABT7XMU0_9NEIS|nr:CNP1-like family protein [Crenobacter sp. SG2303]MDN0075050.1 CNP1-like family protein [Crenobacter sp. SG2303]
MKRLIAATALSLLALHGYARDTMKYSNYAFDEDKPWQENDTALPTYPAQADWVGFYVTNTFANQAAIDAKSLSIDTDHVIRYVLQVKSPAGAENLSYEGLRCSGRLNKTYAFGDTVNHRWIKSQKADWKPLPDELRGRVRTLFCENGTPLDSNAAVALLRAAPKQ